MFVTAEYAASPEYRDFWDAAERAATSSPTSSNASARTDSEVWIQASYNPIFDLPAAVVKVVKFATDITARLDAVKQVGAALEAGGGRSYTVACAMPFSGGFESLRTDFNASLDDLAQGHARCRRLLAIHVGGVQEIAHAADDLARRTEQQAASLEETAAALDQITATVRKTAEGAQQAREVVGERQGRRGDSPARWCSDAVEAMGGIEKLVRQISQIIGVIDEIAFQTNLLALNAGVEAARAGDAGRASRSSPRKCGRWRSARPRRPRRSRR